MPPVEPMTIADLSALGLQPLAKHHRGRIDAPAIVIGPRTMRITVAAYRALGQPVAVEVWYSEQYVAVAPLTTDHRDGYRVDPTTKSFGGSRLTQRIQDAGWPQGRYHATVEDGFLLAERGA